MLVVNFKDIVLSESLYRIAYVDSSGLKSDLDMDK